VRRQNANIFSGGLKYFPMSLGLFPLYAVLDCGKIRYALAAWLIGLPLPFVLLALLIGGCSSW
jgi:hypothetical protein